jgi:hypothetical protein
MRGRATAPNSHNSCNDVEVHLIQNGLGKPFNGSEYGAQALWSRVLRLEAFCVDRLTLCNARILAQRQPGVYNVSAGGSRL